jgi:mannose-6-phosphate isomerase-like protein (cupin superfamily)
MKTWLLAAAALSASGSMANADVTFKFISAEAGAKMTGANPPGKGQDYIANGPAFNFSLRMRDKPGKVEIHRDWNDEIVIQEGKVLLRYGGTSVNAKEIAPGESFGESMTGGDRVLMKAGDIVTIPAGMAHQMLIQTPTMRYILFKTKK